MNNKITERAKKLSEPEILGSYRKEDCMFLLKDVTNKVNDQTNEERERAMQSGTHYSEMLPVEYVPKEDYVTLFHSMLEDTSEMIAKYIAVVSEKILKERGKPILVSLARAGTPIGVLIKRYILQKHNVDLPHYSISIIRDKGFDENALVYIMNKHQTDNLQFIDGWTGKGAINNELIYSCNKFNKKYDVNLDDRMAVIADPSHSVSIFGTRKDIVIPSACLNSTVSGLMSRTFQREDLIKEYDFHGSKFYKEFNRIDLSNYFVDKISEHYKNMNLSENDYPKETNIINSGMKEVLKIGEVFGIKDHQLIKSGVNETARVLLRRIPWKIIVDDMKNPNIKHILMLASDRNVPVEEYKNMKFSCCGLIKVLEK